MIIARESHVRMGEGKDSRQWAGAIGVANVRNAELWTALHSATQYGIPNTTEIRNRESVFENRPFENVLMNIIMNILMNIII